jgi:hypothetical protein
VKRPTILRLQYGIRLVAGKPLFNGEIRAQIGVCRLVRIEREPATRCQNGQDEAAEPTNVLQQPAGRLPCHSDFR